MKPIWVTRWTRWRSRADEHDLLIYVVAALGFVAIVGVGFAFAGAGGDAGAKRVKAIGEGARTKADPQALAKRKQMADTMKGLREREEANRKNRAAGKSIGDRIKQAGWSFSESNFWIASAVAAVAAAAGVYIANLGYLAAVGAAFVVGLGLPRWVLGFAISRRQKKFQSQFADALDVIVRGVKSGLPLNECLKIISTESAQPLAGEFETLVDGLAMGAQLDQGLNKMFQRMPTQEVNFFAIVLGIQAKAGGNLSEALGNLSAVLRSRKLLREKIKALVFGGQGVGDDHWRAADHRHVPRLPDDARLHHGAVHRPARPPDPDDRRRPDELERIRHLPVVHGKKLLGLVTHRDILRAQTRLMAGLRSKDESEFIPLTAKDLMTENVRTTTADTPAKEAARALLDNRFGCLPVLDGEELVGIVTEIDFLRWSLDQLE